MELAMVLLVWAARLRPDSTTHRIEPLPRCIPTEPMPVAGKPRIAGDSVRLRHSLPTPVVRPDSTTRLPMLVVRTVPCYQRVRHERDQPDSIRR